MVQLDRSANAEGMIMSQLPVVRLLLVTMPGRRFARRSLLTLAAASAALALSGAANADTTWVGPVATPAAFETGTNWDTGNVPGGSDFAYIDNGGIASLTTFNGKSWECWLAVPLAPAAAWFRAAGR